MTSNSRSYSDIVHNDDNIKKWEDYKGPWPCDDFDEYIKIIPYIPHIYIARFEYPEETPETEKTFKGEWIDIRSFIASLIKYKFTSVSVDFGGKRARISWYSDIDYIYDDGPNLGCQGIIGIYFYNISKGDIENTVWADFQHNSEPNPIYLDLETGIFEDDPNNIPFLPIHHLDNDDDYGDEEEDYVDEEEDYGDEDDFVPERETTFIPVGFIQLDIGPNPIDLPPVKRSLTKFAGRT